MHLKTVVLLNNFVMNMEAILTVMNTAQAVVSLKKNSGLYGIWTYDLCDTVQRSTNWANEPTGSWLLLLK